MKRLNKPSEIPDLPRADETQRNAVENTKKKRDTNMRNAMIRISAVNIATKDYSKLGVKKGDTVTYTLEDIIKIFDDWSKTKGFKYYIVEHNEDLNNKHYHAVLDFPKDSVCKFSTIKNQVPFGDIESCRSVKACVRYLWHADNEDKFKYSPDDIITNAPDKLETYKLPGKKTVDAKLQKILDMIVSGKLKECDIPTMVESDLYIKYSNRIKNAFEYRRKVLLNDSSRSVNVIAFVGPPGVGKTTFVKNFALKHELTVYFSGSGSDFLGDYMGEDILCIDDLNYENLGIEDCLKLLDPYTNTTVKARYHNRIFQGEYIFLLTNLDITKFYPDSDDSLRMAFYRRISEVFMFQNISDDHTVKYKIYNIVKTDEWEKVYDKYDLYDHSYRKMELEEKYPESYEFDLKKYINFEDSEKQNETLLDQLRDM